MLSIAPEICISINGMCTRSSRALQHINTIIRVKYSKYSRASLVYEYLEPEPEPELDLEVAQDLKPVSATGA